MIESVVLKVTGMKCGGREVNVSSKLQTIEGILSCTASSKQNQVTVEYDTEKTNVDIFKAVIGDAGFTCME